MQHDRDNSSRVQFPGLGADQSAGTAAGQLPEGPIGGDAQKVLDAISGLPGEGIDVLDFLAAIQPDGATAASAPSMAEGALEKFLSAGDADASPDVAAAALEGVRSLSAAQRIPEHILRVLQQRPDKRGS